MLSSTITTTVFQSDLVTFSIQEGILIIEFVEKAKVNLPAAKKLLADRLTFTKGNTFPGLAIAKKGITMTKDARDYLSSEEAMQGINANAFIADSVFKQFFANFFLKVSVTKQKFPTRIFTNKQKALEWLKQFREQDTG